MPHPCWSFLCRVNALHLGSQNTDLFCYVLQEPGQSGPISGSPMKISTRGTGKAGSHVSFSILLSDCLLSLHCKTKNSSSGCCWDEHWGKQRKSYFYGLGSTSSSCPIPQQPYKGQQGLLWKYVLALYCLLPHSIHSFSKQTLDLSSLPCHILLYSASELAAEPKQCLTFV